MKGFLLFVMYILILCSLGHSTSTLLLWNLPIGLCAFSTAAIFSVVLLEKLLGPERN